LIARLAEGFDKERWAQNINTILETDIAALTTAAPTLQRTLRQIGKIEPTNQQGTRSSVIERMQRFKIELITETLRIGQRNQPDELTRWLNELNTYLDLKMLRPLFWRITDPERNFGQKLLAMRMNPKRSANPDQLKFVVFAASEDANGARINEENTKSLFSVVEDGHLVLWYDIESAHDLQTALDDVTKIENSSNTNDSRDVTADVLVIAIHSEPQRMTGANTWWFAVRYFTASSHRIFSAQ
jgi:hypothetical protein